MCGRARCTLNAQQVARACGLNPADAASIPTLNLDRYRPSYNVSPGAYLPVFVVRKEREGSEGGGPLIHCMKWGLVPSFTKKTERPDHFRMFNARSESIKEKASFRRLLPNNRCLVAVEGFYEWKKDGTKKQPYYIHFESHRPLVFAALYDSWQNSEGEVLNTFTILTTRSSSAFQWLHDRMPMILGNRSSIDIWLNVSSPKFETILGPCEDSDLVWYPVTPAVGKISFDGPECIKKMQLKSADEKPLSKFFSKKTKDKCQSEPEVLKSSEELTHGESPNSLKGEPNAEDTEEVTKEEKDVVEPEICGTKRVFEETYLNSGVTTECADSNPTKAAKKEKSSKSSGDKQASLLSYFCRR